jgi:hypothetical protein
MELQSTIETTLLIEPVYSDIITILILSSAVIFTFGYVSILNYTQDWGMKTKHTPNLSERIKDFLNSESELEKIRNNDN